MGGGNNFAIFAILSSSLHQILHFLYLRGTKEEVCEVKEPRPVLDVEDARLKKCIQLFVEFWIFPRKINDQKRGTGP